MAINGTLSVTSQFTANTLVGATTKTANQLLQQRTDLADGSGQNQANKMYSEQKTDLVGTKDYDLNAGGLTDDFGNALSFTNVKLIVVRNLSTTSGQILKVGGAASNPMANLFGNVNDIAYIPPGGCLVLFSPIDGYAVTAGSADVLRVDTGAANIPYQIQVVGS